MVQPAPAASRARDEGSVISDEAHIPPFESEDPDLRSLNNSLAALASIFPNIQVEVFREMLSSFEEESRLALVTEALLKNNKKWINGRYRVVKKETDDAGTQIRRAEHELVSREECFRSRPYKTTVKAIFYQEFKGLSRSTINAVLAESNYSYTITRPTLVELSSKSWRYSISSLFLRRKTTPSLNVDQHPLVVWQSSKSGSGFPALKPTGCAELDKELFDSLIAPWQATTAAERSAKDHEFALELNEKEAEECEALHDCECCFTSTTFEDLSACNGDGHFICFRCLRHATNEAVFGQGWSRSVDLHNGSLRCLAPMADDCRGCIPYKLVCQALADTKGGEEAIRKFDERLAEDNLLKAQLPLVRCPFCSYAEIDQIYLPSSRTPWRLTSRGTFSLCSISFVIFGTGLIPFLLPFFAVFSLLFLLFSSQETFVGFAAAHINKSVTRMRRKRLGLKFTCKNDRCGQSSCISCFKAWTDIHICHESSLTALRTQVELAMSLAIKRTCPRCNTSFVKSSGCNKLTCICGYQMCYNCRKDIGNGEGYRHFCEHFRPTGGRGCGQCNKCDLYRCEDEEVVVRKAKEEAERRWLEAGGENEKVLRGVQRKLEKAGGSGGIFWRGIGCWPGDWEALLDLVVEMLVE